MGMEALELVALAGGQGGVCRTPTAPRKRRLCTAHARVTCHVPSVEIWMAASASVSFAQRTKQFMNLFEPRAPNGARLQYFETKHRKWARVDRIFWFIMRYIPEAFSQPTAAP